jgi:hypothetical protein
MQEVLGGSVQRILEDQVRSYHKNFPATYTDPDTDEEVEVECFFYFYLGHTYTAWDRPPEPPEVDIVDITCGGVSVLNKLTEAQYRKIEGELLALMGDCYV